MSTTVSHPDASKLVRIGIAEMAVSADPDERLITYALGSCLGICIYDPEIGVGGLVHSMLPSGRGKEARARVEPARYVDSGLAALFRAVYQLGARKERIVVHVAGGSRMGPEDAQDNFQIGRRNFVALKKVLWRNGVVLSDKDVGGSVSRTVSLDVGTGTVRVRRQGEEFNLSRGVPRGIQTWSD